MPQDASIQTKPYIEMVFRGNAQSLKDSHSAYREKYEESAHVTKAETHLQEGEVMHTRRYDIKYRKCSLPLVYNGFQPEIYKIDENAKIVCDFNFYQKQQKGEVRLKFYPDKTLMNTADYHRSVQRRLEEHGKYFKNNMIFDYSPKNTVQSYVRSHGYYYK
jgi:hypothetical protein